MGCDWLADELIGAGLEVREGARFVWQCRLLESCAPRCLISKMERLDSDERD